MTVVAKTMLVNKFWILESAGSKVGTLCRQEDNRYMLSTRAGTKMFDTERQLIDEFHGAWSWGNDLIRIEQEQKQKHTHDVNFVYGYPCKFQPCNPIFDVQKKLPLFTKSKKSKSLYCAGYYIIKFEKGWVKSFCPKLLTIDRYDNKGPFKTLLEMKQELSSANQQEGSKNE